MKNILKLEELAMFGLSVWTLWLSHYSGIAVTWHDAPNRRYNAIWTFIYGPDVWIWPEIKPRI